jgi:hypothetical protein
MPYGLLWRTVSAVDLQQEGVEQRSTNIWHLILLNELTVLYDLMKCVRMRQHDSYNNDRALMSATCRLTMCLTTMERTKMYERWKHLEAQFNRKSFQKDIREWPLFLWGLCEKFCNATVGTRSSVRPPHELMRPWPWSQRLSKKSKQSVFIVPHTAVV